jgi:hypothetical protein
MPNIENLRKQAKLYLRWHRELYYPVAAQIRSFLGRFRDLPERQISWAAGTIEHPPAGNTNVPPTGTLFEIIWQVDRDWMPTLRTLCDEQEAKGKVVTRLNSLDELNAFGQSD